MALEQLIMFNFDRKGKEKIEAYLYSPLNLAYMGDSIYSMLVRSRLLEDGNRSVNELNRMANAKVCALAQSANFYKIQQYLTENEIAVMKRGRNAHPSTRAKNASMADYRNATGLEALFGYLYLNGETERLLEIFDKCFDDTDKNEED
ncbi:MAG: ribonuclease III [Defluviitaleaceae bacterium]|nr:ribonuclease III [Defluviitaleaceae bacterium]